MAPRQNRHILRELCPPWLRGPQAYSFLNEGIFTIYDIAVALHVEFIDGFDAACALRVIHPRHPQPSLRHAVYCRRIRRPPP